MGTRLWPLSRLNMPKQLLPLIGDDTLLQKTCKRVLPIVKGEDQWIITSQNYFYEVEKQVTELTNIKEDKPIVLKEPIGKNTSPAIFWAATRVLELYGEDSVLLVFPSDHLILDDNYFVDAINKGIDIAKKGCLVTFGVKPTHAEVGYGYIKINEDNLKVLSFVEKPDMEKAQKYLADGNYYWNSGMFAFHVSTLLKEAGKYCPSIVKPFMECDPFNKEQVYNAYVSVQSLSIDYAVMEHTDKAYMIPAAFGWNDVGSWQSYFEVSEKNQDGNVVKGQNLLIDTSNSLVISDQNRLVAAVGLNNIAIIDTSDALMVCPLAQSQRVKEIVNYLDMQCSKKHIEHRTVQRPWGSYTVIVDAQSYKIKKIVVEPKQKISLQMHYHRSEHWIVVRGTAKVTNGETEIYLNENHSTYIPNMTVHRLENPGKIPLEIIEIQSGSYLGEDDIIRFEDNYGRV